MATWVEPATGRPLAAPPRAAAVVRREHYRSKVGVPPSRVEADRAAQLARLKIMRDEVFRPSGRELRAWKAEVHSDETLARLRAARDRMDRVDKWLALWRRNAGRRTPLPQVLVTSRDESLNAFTEAFVAAQAMVASVAAVTPGHTAAELRAMRRQVHVATQVRGRLTAAGQRLSATGSVGRPAQNPPAAALAAAAAAYSAQRARDVEYRKITLRFYEAARREVATRGTAAHGAALVASAQLRRAAEAVRVGGAG